MFFSLSSPELNLRQETKMDIRAGQAKLNAAYRYFSFFVFNEQTAK
jgi:hypothetical protein